MLGRADQGRVKQSAAGALDPGLTGSRQNGGMKRVLAGLALLTACSPPSAPVQEEPGLHPPTLLRPIEGATIHQNDPTTGCYLAPESGYGHQIAFDWSEVSAASSYHIYAIGSNATFPIIDTIVVASRWFHRSCGYVIDSNRKGWKWRVASVGADGSVGPWSAYRTWDFDAIAWPPRP